MSSSDLDIETISQIFPLSDSESSENLLATGAEEDQTPESGPEIETEQEQAMMNFKTEKSADVSLNPSDIVKSSDGAKEGLCDQEAEENSSSAVQTPESGPGTEQEQAMMNFKTEKSADVRLNPSVKASDGAEKELSDQEAEEEDSSAVQTPESGPGTEQEQVMVNFKTEKSADVSLKPSDIVKASDSAEEELCDQEAEEDSSSAVQTPEEEIKSLRQENKDLKDKLSNLRMCLKRYEEFTEKIIESKNSLEDRLYAKFLPVLNSKKEEILRLQKLLNPDPEEPDYGEDVDTDVDEEDGEGEKKRQKM